ncbi:cytochrome P450 [Algivirga pacifica]|uniref:Cytochrome P450 n=1 Tax=Algivirga pacifica TaxID=1162670 RepID=A0ABP9D3L5_9BACT
MTKKPIYKIRNTAIYNFLKLQQDPIAFFDQLTKESRYQVCTFKGLKGNLYMVSDPELIRKILLKSGKEFLKEPDANKALARVGGYSILNSEGEQWKRNRKILQPAFHWKYLEKLFDNLYAVAEEGVAHLLQQKGKRINIATEMTAITFKAVLRVLYSTDIHMSAKELQQVFATSLEQVTKILFNPFYDLTGFFTGDHQKLQKSNKTIHTLVDQLIQERMAYEGDPKYDLLEMMMNSRYEDNGEKMSREQLRNETITMFFAGHDTTANTLSWAFYYLGKHPDVYQQIKEEVRKVWGEEPPSFEKVRQLTYTQQVVEETMRLSSAVPFINRLSQGAEVEGYHFPKGERVLLSIYHMHRNPEIWEDPEVFNPERFSPEKVKERPVSHFMPFGAGPRMCIGNHFAMLEAVLLLGMLARTFDFELLSEKVGSELIVTHKPKGGVWVKLY